MRVSLAEEYDNRDMVAQMIALKNRQTEAETTVTDAASTAAAAADTATAAAENANSAAATANAASSQATQAAAVVATYNTRLTAAEGDIDTNAGNITALQTRMGVVESKNNQQDIDITALLAADGQNVKISRINEYAVGLTGNQNPINGLKTFISNITQKNTSTPGATSPSSYVSVRESFRITGNDDVTIIGIGFEKSTTDAARLVFRVNGNLNTDTGRTPAAELHFILNEDSGNIILQPAHIDKDGVRKFGTAQTLMTWTP